MTAEWKNIAYKIYRRYCAYRVNDCTNGYPADYQRRGVRVRYHWVCACRKLERPCSRMDCPIMEKIDIEMKKKAVAI